MKPLTKTVLLTGLLVGTTDIIAAHISIWIRSGAFPTHILQYIAGALLGLESSMAGGSGVALFGLFLHYCIAMTWTVFYFVVAPKIKLTSFNPYVVGFLYAVFASNTMTLVVLPLTRLPKAPFQPLSAVIGSCVLAIALGIPIAVSAYRLYRRATV